MLKHKISFLQRIPTIIRKREKLKRINDEALLLLKHKQSKFLESKVLPFNL